MLCGFPSLPKILTVQFFKTSCLLPRKVYQPQAADSCISIPLFSVFAYKQAKANSAFRLVPKSAEEDQGALTGISSNLSIGRECPL